MTADPLVSILIPTYNGERFLRPALRSALGQSYRAVEILVGDDASTDGTAAVLAATEASDPRVRVFRHEQNLGAFGNPRWLFEQARGEYVKFLLHDDVLATDCVRDLVRGLQNNPGTTLAFSRRVVIGQDGRPLPGNEFPALADRPGRLEGRNLGDLTLRTCNNVIGELTTVLFRREDVDSDWMWQVDGRRLEVLGDLSLSLRLLSRGDAFYTPTVLSRFRIHPGQTSFDPWLFARGVRDWPRLIDWAIRNGFLDDDASRRQALGRALFLAAARVEQLGGAPESMAALEGAHLATAALAELAGGVAHDPTRPLTERAHSAPLLDRFDQEIDVWTRHHPVAVASPRPDPAEVEATVQAFRTLRTHGAVERFVLAAPESVVDELVPLVEAALAGGTDVDLDLVRADDPAVLFGRDWLAVTPRGSTWHRGLAGAVLALDCAPRPLPV